MSQQIIKKSDKIKLFLREYYLGHSVARNGVRLIGGPLVTGSGVQFYQKADKWAIAYGGFCFLYGLYFTLKPFLIIALRPAAFQTVTFEVVVNDQGVNWQLAGVESSVQFAAFSSILRRPSYYMLEIKATGTVYLLVNQLTAIEKSFLDSHLTV
ncbi:hypothetical protein Q4S41_21585 [Hymenobacter sp. CA1UV-4]|nr:hypothetical protein [Hymenobacter sp. CA1UV-4]